MKKVIVKCLISTLLCLFIQPFAFGQVDKTETSSDTLYI